MAKYVEPRDLTISGLSFKLTCPEYPEQYDVFSEDGRQVGYVRLRFGYLYASYLDCDGETVYFSEDFAGDGSFFKDKERIFHLSKIAEAIKHRMSEKARQAAALAP